MKIKQTSLNFQDSIYGVHSKACILKKKIAHCPIAILDFKVLLNIFEAKTRCNKKVCINYLSQQTPVTCLRES